MRESLHPLDEHGLPLVGLYRRQKERQGNLEIPCVQTSRVLHLSRPRTLAMLDEILRRVDRLPFVIISVDEIGGSP
jgi:hypothetical protein